LKFDGGRAVLSPSVPGCITFQRLRGRCNPLSSRFISSHSGAFGSKFGSSSMLVRRKLARFYERRSAPVTDHHISTSGLPHCDRRVQVESGRVRGGSLADVERDLIRRTRTAEGRSRAQKRGQRMGRKPKLTPAQKAEARRATGARRNALPNSPAATTWERARFHASPFVAAHFPQSGDNSSLLFG
jgi:hypothetical protein